MSVKSREAARRRTERAEQAAAEAAKITTCPQHKGTCAYTGTEPGRCPGCHSLLAKIAACPCRDCGPDHAGRCGTTARRSPAAPASPAGERHAACTECGHTFSKPRKAGTCQSAAACARRQAARAA
jgi:hypothetical protein